MHVVRRNPSYSSEQRVDAAASRKARLLEVAFISLAATNLFIVTSAIVFYWLSHRN